MEGSVPIVPLAECHIPWWRWLLARLPGFCRYCGRRYIKCIDVGNVSFFEPLPASGRCCPNGHEGWVDGFNVGFGLYRKPFDRIAEKACK